MLHVGITGGIGGGKSTVCRIFESLSIPVFYADQAAKQVMHQDPQLVQAIKTTFGKESYSAQGVLNRSFLAKIVFNNAQQLERLNQLVHPATLRAYNHWAKLQSAPYLLKEAAILFESGSYKYCDYTVLVTAPEDIRIQRVMQRDHISKQEVKARMDKQMPEEEKARMVDFILINDGKQALIPQVLKLHASLLKQCKYA